MPESEKRALRGLSPSLRQVAVSLVVISVLGCGGAPPPSEEDRPLAWQSELEWVRGGAGDSILGLTRVSRQQVTVWGEGRIAIVDAGLGRLMILDADGNLLASREVTGDGPGELRRPYGIGPITSRLLAGIDPIARRLVWWDSTLTAIGERRVPEGTEDAQFAFDGDVLEIVVARRDSVRRKQWALLRDDGTTQEDIAVVARPEFAIGDLPSCGGRGLSSYPLLTLAVVWTTHGGLTAVAESAGYHITLASSGSGKRSLSRRVVPTLADTQLAMRHAAGQLMNGCPVPPVEVVRAFGYAPVVPVIRAMVFSPNGELFVQRRRDGWELVIDVFSADGKYAGTLPEGTPMPVAFVDTARYVALDVDADDVPTVALYRLSR